jgi:pimeloyl-ACP methyl ester carboxylesterase
MSGHSERTISSDGTPIAYWRSGQGPALVLVHGASADHTRWEGVLPFIEPHLTVYAMDRRGRGASGDQTRYALEDEAADVAAVVDAVAAATGGPVDLLGHSYGATCALEAALRTDHVRRLVIYEPALAISTDEFVDELADLLARDRHEDVLITLLRAAGMAPGQLDRARSLPSWPARVAAAHTIVRECRAERAYRFDPQRFAAVRVPTLLLVGSDSAPEIVDESNRLAAAIPAARIGTLAGQTHVAMLSAPDLFTKEILAFLGAPSWRARCPRCGRSRPLDETRAMRIGAASVGKRVFGRCGGCRRWRWIIIEKPPSTIVTEPS